MGFAGVNLDLHGFTEVFTRDQQVILIFKGGFG